MHTTRTSPPAPTTSMRAVRRRASRGGPDGSTARVLECLKAGDELDAEPVDRLLNGWRCAGRRAGQEKLVMGERAALKRRQVGE
mgnify:CR=1 FL=1